MTKLILTKIDGTSLILSFNENSHRANGLNLASVDFDVKLDVADFKDIADEINQDMMRTRAGNRAEIVYNRHLSLGEVWDEFAVAGAEDHYRLDAPQKFTFSGTKLSSRPDSNVVVQTKKEIEQALKTGETDLHEIKGKRRYNAFKFVAKDTVRRDVVRNMGLKP